MFSKKTLLTVGNIQPANLLLLTIFGLHDPKSQIPYIFDQVLYFSMEYFNSGQIIIFLFCTYFVNIWELDLATISWFGST
jgi:hypothetical protein